MITWIQLWPLLGMPLVIISLICAMPTIDFMGRVLGGGAIREWMLNHFLLPVLPQSLAENLVAWFAQATIFQEWLLAVLVGLNLNAILLPVLFLFGGVIIDIRSWVARKDLELKRRQIRR